MHPDIERFLRRATRGLWGEQRRLVRRELQGAIEDRVWRHQVAGCSEAEAVRRALEDLGTPAVIASGMQRTYTWPRVLPLLSIAALLSALSLVPLTQGSAQVVASPLNLTTLLCDSSRTGSEQRAQALVPAVRAQFEHLRRTRPLEIERLCGLITSDLYELVERDSLTATLQPQGVRVTTTPPSDWVQSVQATPGAHAWQWLTFPGNEGAVVLIPLGGGARPLISVYELVYSLLTTHQSPLKVEGEINPRLTIGTTHMVLGTPHTPIRTSLLRTAALAFQLDPLLYGTFDQGLTNTADPSGAPGSAGITVQVRGIVPDGQLVGVLVRRRTSPVMTSPVDSVPAYLLYTTQVQNGQVALLHGMRSKTIQYVDSFSALRQPLPAGVDHQVILMPLDNAEDLSNLSYQVIPPERLRP